LGAIHTLTLLPDRGQYPCRMKHTRGPCCRHHQANTAARSRIPTRVLAPSLAASRCGLLNRTRRRGSCYCPCPAQDRRRDSAYLLLQHRSKAVLIESCNGLPYRLATPTQSPRSILTAPLSSEAVKTDQESRPGQSHFKMPLATRTCVQALPRIDGQLPNLSRNVSLTGEGQTARKVVISPKVCALLGILRPEYDVQSKSEGDCQSLAAGMIYMVRNKGRPTRSLVRACRAADARR